MADRLAEIEGIQDALHDIPDDISVPVSAGLARDLLAVAKAARDLMALPEQSPNLGKKEDALVAALANLEGGAT